MTALTFDTIADAATATIPATTTSVRALGATFSGDGFEGVFTYQATTPDPFIGPYDKFQNSGTGKWYVRTDARVISKVQTPMGWYTNDAMPSRIDRFYGRQFGGLAAEQSFGTIQSFEIPGYRRLHTWLSGWTVEDTGENRSGPGEYIEKGSALLWVSKNGGTAITGASRSSDRWRIRPGYRLWKTNEIVAVGTKRYYNNKFYKATIAGTTGTAGPSHGSGTATDGTVTWEFVDDSPGSTIGGAFCACTDLTEPNGGAWAIYSEGQRESDGNTIFGREIGMKNKGSNIHNNPYNRFPGGSTIGDWFAGGGDGTTGAPANSSTCAILIGANTQSWNKGIVFQNDGIANVGTIGRIAIGLAKDQRIAWFTPESSSSDVGVVGSAIEGDVTETAKQTGLIFSNDNVRLTARRLTLASFENGAIANAPNYHRFISKASGMSPEIVVAGPDANIDLQISPKGSGVIKFGYNSGNVVNAAAFTADRYIVVKQNDGTNLFIPCRLWGW